jgi:hypothetical protein
MSTNNREIMSAKKVLHGYDRMNHRKRLGQQEADNGLFYCFIGILVGLGNNLLIADCN